MNKLTYTVLLIFIILVSVISNDKASIIANHLGISVNTFTLASASIGLFILLQVLMKNARIVAQECVVDLINFAQNAVRTLAEQKSLPGSKY